MSNFQPCSIENDLIVACFIPSKAGENERIDKTLNNLRFSWRIYFASRNANQTPTVEIIELMRLLGAWSCVEVKRDLMRWLGRIR